MMEKWKWRLSQSTGTKMLPPEDNKNKDGKLKTLSPSTTNKGSPVEDSKNKDERKKRYLHPPPTIPLL